MRPNGKFGNEKSHSKAQIQDRGCEALQVAANELRLMNVSGKTMKLVAQSAKPHGQGFLVIERDAGIKTGAEGGFRRLPGVAKDLRDLGFRRPVLRPYDHAPCPWPQSILFGQVAFIITRLFGRGHRDSSRASIPRDRQPVPGHGAAVRSGSRRSLRRATGRCGSGS